MELYGTEAGFCAQTANLWQLVGYFLLVFKIVIPIILIITGIITLGKAVISADDKDAKKGFTSMIKKFVVAAVIFFLPTIITAMFGIINEFHEIEKDYNVCNKCISYPNSEYCNKKVLALEEDV